MCNIHPTFLSPWREGVLQKALLGVQSELHPPLKWPHQTCGRWDGITHCSVSWRETTSLAGFVCSLPSILIIHIPSLHTMLHQNLLTHPKSDSPKACNFFSLPVLCQLRIHIGIIYAFALRGAKTHRHFPTLQGSQTAAVSLCVTPWETWWETLTNPQPAVSKLHWKTWHFNEMYYINRFHITVLG